MSRIRLSAATRRHISRLFSALEYGEQLAQECARRQAAMVDSGHLQRLLLRQARQEAFHARCFRHACRHLDAGRHQRPPTALRRFGCRLSTALQREDLTETLVGQQIVLEGFGEAVLARLSTGMDRQGVGLAGLRRAVLQQEREHQALGQRLLAELIETGAARGELVHEQAQGYLILVDDILADMAEVFLSLDEDPRDYVQDLKAGLPPWLQAPQS